MLGSLALAQSLALEVPHLLACKMGITFLADFMRRERPVRILGHE